MPIRIRKASPADQAAIDQWQQSLENVDEYLHIPGTSVRDPDAVKQRFEEWLKLPRGQKVPMGWERVDLVAVDDAGSICGFASLLFGVKDKLTGGSEAYLSELHVWPQYRNKSVALGLLEMAEAFATQRGAPYLSLHVPASSISAIRLFQSAGFRQELLKMTKKTGRNREV